MKEIFLGTVTVEGWEKVKIEGQKGIIGYSAEEVAFRVPGGLLRIRGNGLNIDEISAEIAVVSGRIEGIDREKAKPPKSRAYR